MVAEETDHLAARCLPLSVRNGRQGLDQAGEALLGEVTGEFEGTHGVSNTKMYAAALGADGEGQEPKTASRGLMPCAMLTPWTCEVLSIG